MQDGENTCYHCHHKPRCYGLIESKVNKTPMQSRDSHTCESTPKLQIETTEL